MERVFIFRVGSVGDTVVALPCFHLIERAFPDAERIALMAFPAVSNWPPPLEEVLKGGGLIHGAIRYEPGIRHPVSLARLVRMLRRQHAETLVYLAPSKGVAATRRDVAFFKLCGFRRIIGAPVTKDLQLPRVGERGELERESLRLGRTLASLGTIDFSDRSWWDLRMTDGERAAGEEALGPLRAQPFVAVHTGGKAQGDWGEANWATLLSGLAAPLAGYGLLLVGGVDDGPRARRLGARWAASPVVDLCGRLGLRETAAALSRAELFIGHDSGPLHLADAAGTRCVGVFGPFNRPKLWHPCGERTRIIHSMQGLGTIMPAHVADTALELLGYESSGSSAVRT